LQKYGSRTALPSNIPCFSGGGKITSHFIKLSQALLQVNESKVRPKYKKQHFRITPADRGLNAHLLAQQQKSRS